jgi:ribonuclease-3
MRPGAAVAARIGLDVRDHDLIEQALVHSSWLHEHPDAVRGHNERLEFLGDAVVNLALSEAVFARHPDDDEGLLSARRATIVSTAGLARLAGRIELGEHLRLGEGEAQRGGRRRPSLLASAFEALAGALYLDLGYPATRDWLLALAAEDLDASAAAPGSLKSPKSRLQELTQRQTGSRPDYRIISAVGPDHEKHFRIAVVVEGAEVGVGEGLSRRIAETAAAAQALEALATRSARAAPAAPAEVTDPGTTDPGATESTAPPPATAADLDAEGPR